MQLSMWTYPWDVQDIGADRVLGDLRDRAGLNMVSLATAYHAGRFLQPRSPVRKSFYPEDGTLYFQPTAARWQDLAIQPKVADIVTERGDVLADLIRRRDAGGMAVSCWTVCLHNTRLGMEHPQAAARGAFGDISYFSLCPSNPDVRAYARALVADLTHSYRPDRIELETPSFMGFVHGFHHEKDGVGLTAEDDFLLSICFCDSCLERAAKAGVDGAPAQALVRQWLVETFERETPSPRFPDFPASGLPTFEPYPELYDYLVWRFEPVTSLVAELKEAAHPETQVVVIDLVNGWLGGCDNPSIARACDGMILCAYDMDEAGVAALLREGREAVGPDKFLGTGFRLFYPEMPSAERFVAKVGSAFDAGVDGINFYNYGLVPAKRLDWMTAASARARI